MLHKWHILWGAIFTIIIWIIAPDLNLFYLLLIFLSSFLIDFDHYVVAVYRMKGISFSKAVQYHKEQAKKTIREKKKGIKKRGEFFIFHTIEAHILVAVLSLLWLGFLYIFIGMVFHSLLDLAWLLKNDIFHAREYFFFNWLRKKF